jgi:hypothetical protein
MNMSKQRQATPTADVDGLNAQFPKVVNGVRIPRLVNIRDGYLAGTGAAVVIDAEPCTLYTYAYFEQMGPGHVRCGPVRDMPGVWVRVWVREGVEQVYTVVVRQRTWDVADGFELDNGMIEGALGDEEPLALAVPDAAGFIVGEGDLV